MVKSYLEYSDWNPSTSYEPYRADVNTGVDTNKIVPISTLSYLANNELLHRSTGGNWSNSIAFTNSHAVVKRLERVRGKVRYELKNFRGDIRQVISDVKYREEVNGVVEYTADVWQVEDSYPFGWSIKDRSFTHPNPDESYRFGFNGKENDKDFGEQLIQDYGFRLYNPAIAKFLSVDPLAPEYPELTPYQFASNTPIQAIDLDGLEKFEIKYINTEKSKARVNLVNVNDALSLTYRGKEVSINTESFKSFKKWYNEAGFYVERGRLISPDPSYREVRGERYAGAASSIPGSTQQFAEMIPGDFSDAGGEATNKSTEGIYNLTVTGIIQPIAIENTIILRPSPPNVSNVPGGAINFLSGQATVTPAAAAAANALENSMVAQLQANPNTRLNIIGSALMRTVDTNTSSVPSNPSLTYAQLKNNRANTIRNNILAIDSTLTNRVTTSITGSNSTDQAINFRLSTTSNNPPDPEVKTSMSTGEIEVKIK